MFSTNDLNSMIDQASKVLNCDVNCQNKQKKEQLEQLYNKARENIETAPYQLEQAKKNYITFVQGDTAYSEIQEKELAQKATEEINKKSKDYDDLYNKAMEAIRAYTSFRVNYSNIDDLLMKYKTENENLKKTIKNDMSQSITNDRKTFYSAEDIDTLTLYHKLFVIAFFVFLICYFFLVMFPINILIILITAVCILYAGYFAKNQPTYIVYILYAIGVAIIEGFIYLFAKDSLAIKDNIIFLCLCLLPFAMPYVVQIAYTLIEKSYFALTP